MDAKSVYITVMLIILANGGVLSAILSDFPAALRPAARIWQWATLLVALGCGIFAAEVYLPKNFTVIVANIVLVIALSMYHLAIRRFHGLQLYSNVLLVPLFGMLAFLYYIVFVPDIKARVVIVSVLWACIMLASTSILISKEHSAEYQSRSRFAMAVIYMMAAFTTILRAVLYVSLDTQANFTIADNTHWMNSVTPVFLSVLPVIGTTTFLLMCSDQVKRRWQNAASRDYLTDLPNRRSLIAYGTSIIESGDETSKHRAVAVLDIDWFKSINDTYGHFAGDLVLQTLAQRLKAVLEADDFIARTGGEEFVIIFGEKGSLNAELAAEHIRNAVAESMFAIENTSISVTVSIGLVTRSAPAKFEDVMIRADKALYTAKNSGRNRTEVVAMGEA
ncbi:GGDEF domain-containing protein [Ochrobactrum sp. RH2CCR150]|uniref:GGDEF domain-containing protein n=1 Tax=Ochrobactrum sp. RH2CCR150 TaxID=2587044 RepID=UPI0015FC53C7|nr:diguanylate cyclase (GGDEF)-like protein [Ochrobactrum sp. RH2CCR150]